MLLVFTTKQFCNYCLKFQEAIVFHEKISFEYFQIDTFQKCFHAIK